MSDISTAQVFSNAEKGITAAKLNNIISAATINPAFIASKPVTSALNPGDQLIVLKADGTYAKVDESVLVSSVAGQLPSADPEIWSVRLRSFNAIGNPTFEVDQRNAGAQTATGFMQDRWNPGKVGTMAYTGQKVNPTAGNQPQAPGTSFSLSNSLGRIVIATAQSTLGVGDYLYIVQTVEGPCFRELSSDVHSISMLVKSSVANLKFSVALMDSGPATKSLVKLCTIPTANVWTLIQLPNLPTWPSGNFSSFSGVPGYQFSICLAAGTSLIAPAADTWQTGSFLGAPGMSNLAATLNASFDVGFIQHEPGPKCSTFIDKPFTQNLDECLRYYQKSYDYAVKPGTATGNPLCAITSQGNSDLAGWIPFSKRMAVRPTQVLIWNHATGTANSSQARDGTNRTLNAINNYGEMGIGGFSLTTTPAVGMPQYFHYTADTGW